MDNGLFWKLLEPIHPAAVAFSRKLAGGRDEGDDLYQDAVLMAMRKFRQLKERSAFKPWFFRIVVNCGKNRYRTPWHRRKIPLSNPESGPNIDPRGEHEARRLLEGALKELSSDDRALIILHDLQGWSMPDLATMLKKPEGTVKNRIFRAKQKMRKYLERHLQKCKNIKLEEAAYALQGSKMADD
jgi:RNA polymerase sigma-70 factor, ECF subfamily